MHVIVNRSKCLCLTEEDHCTFIKVQPSWLTDARRFDFALGFETRDGFKCKEIAPTQPPTTTTTPEITSCDALPMPGSVSITAILYNYITYIVYIIVTNLLTV